MKIADEIAMLAALPNPTQTQRATLKFLRAKEKEPPYRVTYRTSHPNHRPPPPDSEQAKTYKPQS